MKSRHVAAPRHRPEGTGGPRLDPGVRLTRFFASDITQRDNPPNGGPHAHRHGRDSGAAYRVSDRSANFRDEETSKAAGSQAHVRRLPALSLLGDGKPNLPASFAPAALATRWR